MTDKLTGSLVFVLLSTACPQAPLTSVDGLEGGGLLSGLSAPSINTERLVVDGNASLADTSARALTCESVTTTTATAETVAATAIQVRGLGMFGAPLGTIPGQQFAVPYVDADNACRAAFGDDAHMCSSDEFIFALRSGAEIPASMSGASVNTFTWSAALTTTNLDQGELRTFVINDCQGWTSIMNGGGNANRPAFGTTEVAPWVDASLMMVLEERTGGNGWHLTPNQDGCQVGDHEGEYKLACCG